jgi:uncharacterized protein (DUF2141 family)
VTKASLKAVGAGAAALTLALQTGAAQAAVGPDAAACAPRSGRTALLVDVRGFRARAGSLRIALYGSDPASFLTRGGALRRIDLPVGRAASMPVCVALPSPGRYAIAVRHDENGNGDTDWDDGGGFSRNPQLSLAARPRFDDVAIDARRGVQTVPVTLNYRSGFTIGPAVPSGKR